jgi:dihydroorotate dehydrogenase (NAD+) catalytic subunit
MAPYSSVVRSLITSNPLEVVVGGLRLEHPVLNASGVLGFEPEHVAILARAGFSGIVTKTFTRDRREGHPPPIIVELDNGGLINAVGLSNPGIGGICPVVKAAKALGKPVVVSVGGGSSEELVELVARAEECGTDAIELNLSCPNVRYGGIEIGSNPSLVYSFVRDVTSTTKLPVFAKLGLCDKAVEVASKVIEAGASGLTLINTIKAMVIDVYAAKPILSNRYGGLSGPPIKPIALRVVYEVYEELSVDIIGCGGISTWRDAAEFILAGAKALQVGTAFIKNKAVVNEILSGLKKWIELIGASRVLDLVGLAHRR